MFKYIKIYNLFLLISLMFVSQINGQQHNQVILTQDQILELFKNRFNTTVDTTSKSDLLTIIFSGGLANVDTSTLRGKVLTDSTISYDGDNHSYLLTFYVDYIQNGKVVSEWNETVDSANVSYKIKGHSENILFSEDREQYADKFVIAGLSSSSQYATCGLNPMFILSMKLKWWLICDLFFEDNIELWELRIDKATQKIEDGRGAIHSKIWTFIRDDHFSNIDAEIYMVYPYTFKIIIGDHEFYVNYAITTYLP